jgi:hypothetical protein
MMLWKLLPILSSPFSLIILKHPNQRLPRYYQRYFVTAFQNSLTSSRKSSVQQNQRLPSHSSHSSHSTTGSTLVFDHTSKSTCCTTSATASSTSTSFVPSSRSYFYLSMSSSIPSSSFHSPTIETITTTKGNEIDANEDITPHVKEKKRTIRATYDVDNINDDHDHYHDDSTTTTTASAAAAAAAAATNNDHVPLYVSQGLFSVIKPLSWTSNDVVTYVRRILERDAQARQGIITKSSSLSLTSSSLSTTTTTTTTAGGKESNNNAKRSSTKRMKMKVGHGGTLDPLATGVLVIGVGHGTKELTTYVQQIPSVVVAVVLVCFCFLFCVSMP